jgi:hypothetical protein
MLALKSDRSLVAARASSSSCTRSDACTINALEGMHVFTVSLTAEAHAHFPYITVSSFSLHYNLSCLFLFINTQ